MNSILTPALFGSRVLVFSNVVAALALATASGASTDANDSRLVPEFVGVRAGRSEPPSVYHTEVYGGWALPWKASKEQGFTITTFLSGAIGWIGDNENDTTVGSLGPSFRLNYRTLPISLIGGSSPTLIGRNQIGGRNLGSAFHFTSHIGISLNVGFAAELGYRLQHMSNAGLGNDNPGLNSQVIFVGWKL